MLASELPGHITQTDPTRYRDPDGLPPGSVLVVGAGASGIQIAEELIGAGRTVFLAASRHRRIPRRFRGRDVYWWLDRMGRFEQTIDAFPDRRWPPHTAVTGVNGGHDIDLRSLASAGAHVVGSVLGVCGTRLVLADNANQILDEADAAYLSFIEAARAFASSSTNRWAMTTLSCQAGHRFPRSTRSTSIGKASPASSGRRGTTTTTTGSTPTSSTPTTDPSNAGVTAVPGLFFLGLHWMHTFKSGLLSGVGTDAQFSPTNSAHALGQPQQALGTDSLHGLSR